MASANIITLENLSEKLTPWSPNDKSHLYAIVDMGRYVVPFTEQALMLTIFQQRHSLLHHIPSPSNYSSLASCLLREGWNLSV